MPGTQARCPNIIKNDLGQDSICGCTSFYVLERKVFDSQDGLDPLAEKVCCKECGHIYYIFPAINYKEE